MESHNIHWTTQRRVIYNVVRAAKDHPTAKDIMDRLRDEGHSFAYGTVYNALRYLVDAGLLLELQLGDGASRYDGRTEEHLHLKCDRCGRIEEAGIAVPDAWLTAVHEETGFAVLRTDIVLHGLCESCREGADGNPREA
ncbi:MAG: transcriptional repressor [Alicyclobacillus sp.]|nr:transcriptional repressor [Alicyclobacillus sp.]